MKALLAKKSEKETEKLGRGIIIAVCILAIIPSGLAYGTYYVGFSARAIFVWITSTLVILTSLIIFADMQTNGWLVCLKKTITSIKNRKENVMQFSGFGGLFQIGGVIRSPITTESLLMQRAKKGLVCIAGALSLVFFLDSLNWINLASLAIAIMVVGICESLRLRSYNRDIRKVLFLGIVVCPGCGSLAAEPMATRRYPARIRGRSSKANEEGEQQYKCVCGTVFYR